MNAHSPITISFSKNRIKFIQVLIALIFMLSLLGVQPIQPLQAATLQATAITFSGTELLGRPTDDSITINIVPDTTIEYHYQYGISSGVYTGQTLNQTAISGQPHEIVISGLTANTQYYYRMRYHLLGEIDWVERVEHSFWTQRAPGSSFTFTVTSDSHQTFNTNHQNAMTNINNEHPDFEIDLGDTFYPDGMTSQSAVNTKYMAYRNSLYMGKIGPSVPIFLASGNHENEEGWNFDDTPFSIALGSLQARKAYFPTPINDAFYSANTDPLAAIDETTYGDEYRENYYAWTWGDALFVVINEFQYTMNLPYTPTAGEGSDDSMTGDQWSWTLGAQQFQWFKQTLENSDAKYKFVFSHQMLGGVPRAIAGVGAGYVRGGAEAAAYFEWGGKNADGTAGFAAHRNPADFGTVPIHQLMMANGVSAYFHGHDHQYVYETRDGIVYQEVPSPSMAGSGFSGIYTEGDHGTYNTIKMLPSPGHLRITITPTLATVDYVSSTSTAGTVNYSYAILPNASATTYDLTTAVSPSAAGTIDPAAGTHTYDEGTVVNITATPASEYAFDHWSGDCSGTGTCQVTMNGDKTVTANFIPEYTLTVAVNPTGGGMTNPTVGVHTYPENTVVSVTATPYAGYVFANWSGACSGTGTCQVIMNGDKTVTANFTPIEYTLTVTSAHGTVAKDPNQATYHYGDVVQLTATPAAGWTFANWSGDASGAANPVSVTMNGNKAVTANYTAIEYTLTLTSAHGTVAKDPNQATYHYGDVVQLTATPAVGWTFANWSGDASGAANPVSVTMNGNKAVTANYTAIEYTLALTSAHGTVAKVPDQATYHYWDVVQLTATPSAGWTFANWSGDTSGTANPISVTMNGNKTVTANYTSNLRISYLPLVIGP